jgi:hypothetical protein
MTGVIFLVTIRKDGKPDGRAGRKLPERVNSFYYNLPKEDGRRLALMTWYEIRTRCGGRKGRCKEFYQDKGIEVCQKWLDSFESFLSDMGERAKEMTIDRIDNSKGYSPDNCRWVTLKENGLNRGGKTCKLSHPLAVNMIIDYLDGYDMKQIKSKYGVGRQCEKVIKGDHWKGAGQEAIEIMRGRFA